MPQGEQSYCSNEDFMSDRKGLDIGAVIRTVLYLLEQTEYPGRNSSAVSELKSCMQRAITLLESELRARPN
jgi:hypothetical protein